MVRQHILSMKNFTSSIHGLWFRICYECRFNDSLGRGAAEEEKCTVAVWKTGKSIFENASENMDIAQLEAFCKERSCIGHSSLGSNNRANTDIMKMTHTIYEIQSKRGIWRSENQHLRPSIHAMGIAGNVSQAIGVISKSLGCTRWNGLFRGIARWSH